jgi:hypothetical protein
MLEKKWEYNETEHQLFLDFMKACGGYEERPSSGMLRHVALVRIDILHLLISFQRT